MRFLSAFRRRPFVILGGTSVGLAMAAGIAGASIPDAGGVIHACYLRIPHRAAPRDRPDGHRPAVTDVESRAIFVGLVDFDVPDRLVREGIPEGSGAVVRLLVVSAVALAIATWRMGHLRLGGASD